MRSQFESPMKIELDIDITSVLVAVCSAAVICTIVLCIFRYNALPYEQGYSQQQLENGCIIWVKDHPK